MAAPSEAEIQDQISKQIQILDELDKMGRSNTKNIGGMYDALVLVLKGDYVTDSIAALDGLRGDFASLMDPALGAQLIDPLLLEYAKQQSFPETDPQEIIDRLVRYFTDNSKHVQTRAFSFGSPSAGGSNAGDGVLNRLNKDENNDDIENQTADAKTAECVSDEHSGAAEHRELFEVRASEAPRDFVAGIVGGQRIGSLTAISADASAPFIQNASLSQYEGTLTVPTAITGWTPTAIGNYEMVEGAANVYRGSTTEGDTPRSVKFKTADKLVQNFNVNRATFNPAVPMYCQVAVNKSVGSGAGGNFILRMGSQTTTTALTALGAGWNIVKIALGTGNWFLNWNQEDPTIELEWATSSSGYLLVDDVVLAPMQFFDGGWYALVGGSTPFLYRDVFTFTDTATGSILQEWFWRIYGRYLPHTASGTPPSWVDPT